MDVLKQLKKEYMAIEPTALLREHGWEALRGRIAEEQVFWRKPLYLMITIVLLIIVTTGGTVYAAQSAKPGDVLYPVKVASNRVAAQIAPILNRPEGEHKEEVVEHTDTPRAEEKVETEKVEKIKEAIDAVTKEKDDKKDEEKKGKKDNERPVRDVEIPRDVPVTVPSSVPTAPPALEVVPPIPSVGL